MLDMKKAFLPLALVISTTFVSLNACMAKPAIKVEPVKTQVVNKKQTVAKVASDKPSAAVMTATYKEKAELEAKMVTLRAERDLLYQTREAEKEVCLGVTGETHADIILAHKECMSTVIDPSDFIIPKMVKVNARLDQLQAVLDKDPNGCSVADCS